MKLKSIQLLTVMALLGWVSSGQAAITCTNPTSTGFSTAINAVAGINASVVPNITQGTVTFNCTRTVAGDPLSVTLRALDGLWAAGTQNRARLGATANYINYEAYKDSACSALWTNNAVPNYITVPLLNVLGAQPLTVNFWGCITVAPVVPAGTYTDTVALRVRNDAGTGNLANGTFAVSIDARATCSISTAPGNVAFTYTSFGPIANASTTFGATCTLNLPYTLSLDAYSGTLLGLNYTLSINPVPVPRGTGGATIHTINGSIAAGQAGTCATGTCNASQTRTLTITY